MKGVLLDTDRSDNLYLFIKLTKEGIKRPNLNLITCQIKDQGKDTKKQHKTRDEKMQEVL